MVDLSWEQWSEFAAGVGEGDFAAWWSVIYDFEGELGGEALDVG